MVADLGSYISGGAVTSLSVDQLRFVPELHRTQVGRDNAGGVVIWNGAGSGNTTLPNGYYRLQVQSPGGALVEAEFYLEHQAWDAGQIYVSLLPRSSEARIIWGYSEPVRIRFDLYNLPGELIWTGRVEGAGGEIRWQLSASSQQPVAGGIYILKAHVHSLDGALDDVKLFKLAVVR